ncbi:MAG: DNA polymerase III subunit delta' [Desulfuromonadaceae bacterium]|nr:DNA polymerase III subunit delta' [Desulfuromonadaceae bacterium]
MLGDGIIGHKRQKELLQKSLDGERVASAYLFSGPAGVGKKLLALNFLKIFFCDHKKGCGTCVNCKKMAQQVHPDLFFLDGSVGSIKIDEVRLIQKHLKYHPLEAPRKVCLIDDAERMTPAAQSAFLKTLEEPRDSTLFILVSSQPDSLLATIRSRCQTINFGRIPREGMTRHLVQHHGMEEMEARVLAAVADGSLAKALKEDQDLYRRDRTKLIEEIAALPEAMDNVLPHFQLSRLLTEKKQAQDARLELLQLFFRDVLFLLEGRTEADLINIDLAEIIRRRAERETSDSLLAKLEALREAGLALDGNANLQLTMDVLLMRLSRPAE